MKIFQRVFYSDGGPNDKGVVVEYKMVKKNEASPKPKHGFEEWREISFNTYNTRKKIAYNAYKIFTF